MKKAEKRISAVKPKKYENLTYLRPETNYFIAILADVVEENADLKTKMIEKLSRLKTANMTFHNKMKGLNAADPDLGDMESVADTSRGLIHPFFNKNCEFYQKHTTETMIEKKDVQAKDRPFALDEDLDLVEVIRK